MADAQVKPQEKKAANPTIILAAVIVISTFASSFLAVKIMSPGAAGETKDVKTVVKDVKEVKVVKTVTEIIKLGEFVVNLANKDSTRYLKADISVENTKEVKKGQKEKEGEKGKGSGLGENEPKVRDLIIEVLSSHTTQELGSMEGKKLLKEELIKALNDNVEGMKVVNIYFNSFMMQ